MLRKYLLTLAILAASTALQGLLWPIISPAPFILYYPGVILAALYGDGITAIIGSALLTQFFFVEPLHSLHLRWPEDVVRQALFIVSAVMIRQITKRLSDALARERDERRTHERELERAFDASRQSDERTRAVLEGALDAVVAIDAAGKVVHWNAQAERTFGVPRADAVGAMMDRLIIPERHRAGHAGGLARYLRTGEGPILSRRIEIQAQRRDGSELPVELTVIPVGSGQASVFYAFVRDISERVKFVADLRAAVQARDEFIGVAGHELRTPITSLMLHNELAERQLERGDARAHSLEGVARRVSSTKRQLQRMARLIDDLLDVSRMGPSRPILRLERVDLGALVAECAERFGEELSAVGAPLSTGIAPGVEVECDPYRVEQVLANLLTNALKYGAGKPVRVTVARVGERVRIQVADQGLGLAPGDRERVFERFERAVSSKHVSGLGLGLYISREIVSAHHGTISVESELGRGSTFTVELPLVQPERAVAAAPF